MPISTELRGVVAEHIAAVNAFDVDRIVATFAPDAYVNDDRREIWGTDAIRAFIEKEFVGDSVTMDVREVLDHYGDVIVRARYDGTYDKTNLPDELVLTSYFGIRDGKITSLTIILNQPSPYYLVQRAQPSGAAGVRSGDRLDEHDAVGRTGGAVVVGDDVEGSAVVATEHARETASIDLDRVEHLATGADA